MSSSTKDRILDAYRDLLVEHGIAGVSLEAVAARAGVSKGGLLYHFPAKVSLLTGLTDRLRAYTDENVRRAREEGIVETFLRTSTPREEEARHYWAVLTAIGGDRASAPEEARRTLDDVFDVWSDLLREVVPDPVLADTIRLVGDGLYLTTISGLPRPDDERTDAVVADLIGRAGVRG